MAKVYQTPGVYIEEIPKFPPSVAQVATAIPVFIGYTEKRQINGVDIPTQTIDTFEICEAQRISSMLEYEALFGSCPAEEITVKIVVDTDTNVKTASASITTPSEHTMYYHMQMYFANGGGPCYVISVGDTAESVDGDALVAGVKMSSNYDEPTLIVVPQVQFLAQAKAQNVYQEALKQASELKDRFVIMDCFDNDNPTNARAAVGNNHLKYGALYHPYLKSSLPCVYDLEAIVIEHSEDPALTTYASLNTELQNMVKAELSNLSPVLPPSSAIAGVYAMVDSNKGVWCAPANVSLARVIGPTKAINEMEQANFNVDADTGKSINIIRSFTGKGTLVWGARTLAGNDNEWRYISVRRFFNMVEESVKKATETFVFEPNDSHTWIKVQGMIENYLTNLWRDGALQGSKPEDAFRVAVGLHKTMTAQDILDGLMIVEIALAAVRPAEFIVLRFSHKMAES